MQQFYLRYPGFRRKALLLSFDDGHKEDLRFQTLLKCFGIKGTFNINSGYLTGKLPEETPSSIRLSIREVQQLLENGHELAIHTYSHPFLSTLPAGQVAAQILYDRCALEQLCPQATLITGLALPFEAEANAEVFQAAKACGITYIRSLTPSYRFSLPMDFYRWHVTCHFRDPRFEELCRNFLAGRPTWTSEVFFVWGHSHELRTKEDWNSWERACSQLGGHEDIWYAGCGELCDYVRAAGCLQSSADGKTIYNTSATTLYVESDPTGMQITLHPGQQVQLEWSIL